MFLPKSYSKSIKWLMLISRTILKSNSIGNQHHLDCHIVPKVFDSMSPIQPGSLSSAHDSWAENVDLHKSKRGSRIPLCLLVRHHGLFDKLLASFSYSLTGSVNFLKRFLLSFCFLVQNFQDILLVFPVRCNFLNISNVSLGVFVLCGTLFGYFALKLAVHIWMKTQFKGKSFENYLQTVKIQKLRYKSQLPRHSRPNELRCLFRCYVNVNDSSKCIFINKVRVNFLHNYKRNKIDLCICVKCARFALIESLNGRIVMLLKSDAWHTHTHAFCLHVAKGNGTATLIWSCLQSVSMCTN